MKKRGITEDSMVLVWNSWKKRTAIYCDGGEQAWSELEKPIQHSNGLFGTSIWSSGQRLGPEM